jgi:hypothetical protein
MTGFWDVPDEILIKIFEFTDYNSKLNLLLVNKYFYNLIARNQQLCRYYLNIVKEKSYNFLSFLKKGQDFHLKIKWDSYSSELKNNERIFKSLMIRGCFELYIQENFMGILELLENVGFYIKELKILETKIGRNQFYQILGLIPNVELIAVDFLEFVFKESEEVPVIGHNFKKLKTLSLYSKVEWGYGDHPKYQN